MEMFSYCGGGGGGGGVNDDDALGRVGVDHCAIDMTNSAAGNPKHSSTTHPNLQRY